jgi:hypothetical protein
LRSIFDRLFGRFRPAREEPNWEPTLLVQRPGESAPSPAASKRENDLDYMKRCCDAELKSMAATGLVASPFCFERVAILCHEAQDYRCEARYCEKYLSVVEAHFSQPRSSQEVDVRDGPGYQAIVLRLRKARELLAKSKAKKARSAQRPAHARSAAQD